jgi:hypothetical protein
VTRWGQVRIRKQAVEGSDPHGGLRYVCTFSTPVSPHAYPPMKMEQTGRAETSAFNLYEPCVLYIGQAHRYPPNTPFYIFFKQIYVLHFLNMLHILLFFFSFFLFKMSFIS